MGLPFEYLKANHPALQSEILKTVAGCDDGYSSVGGEGKTLSVCAAQMAVQLSDGRDTNSRRFKCKTSSAKIKAYCYEGNYYLQELLLRISYTAPCYLCFCCMNLFVMDSHYVQEIMEASEDLERLIGGENGVTNCRLKDICKVFDLNTMDVLKYQQH